MALNSSVVAAADTVTATERNNLRKDIIGCGADLATSGGTANVQTLSIDAQYVAYRAGDLIKFKAGFTNTGACTLTINSIAGGAKTIQRQGVALTGGEIIKDNIICVVYDGTYFQILDTGRMVGEIAIWPTDTAPAGWLLCYGQIVSQTTYAALYSIIGHTFAADPGGGNFTLPDFRGRMPLGQDDMGGSSANRVTNAQADLVGGVEGEEKHTLITAELAAHTHNINTRAPAGGTSYVAVGGNNAPDYPVATDSTGSGTAHNNMPPYLTLNYIIKF